MIPAAKRERVISISRTSMKRVVGYRYPKCGRTLAAGKTLLVAGKIFLAQGAAKLPRYTSAVPVDAIARTALTASSVVNARSAASRFKTNTNSARNVAVCWRGGEKPPCLSLANGAARSSDVTHPRQTGNFAVENAKGIRNAGDKHLGC